MALNSWISWALQWQAYNTTPSSHSAGDQTQALVYTRQALYQLNYVRSPLAPPLLCVITCSSMDPSGGWHQVSSSKEHADLAGLAGYHAPGSSCLYLHGAGIAHTCHLIRLFTWVQGNCLAGALPTKPNPQLSLPFGTKHLLPEKLSLVIPSHSRHQPRASKVGLDGKSKAYPTEQQSWEYLKSCFQPRGRSQQGSTNCPEVSRGGV